MQLSGKSEHRFHQSGEIHFFETLYKEYFHRVLFFARQYLPDPEEAREIAQETFVTLWEKRREVHMELNIQAFILTIAKNKCLNSLRKKISEQKYTDYLSAREMMANYSALAEDTFSSIEMQELEGLLQQTLHELPEKTRLIWQLNRDKEMTYEQIAGEIHLSVKSVEYHMTKALLHFRNKLKDYLPTIILATISIYSIKKFTGEW